jgi:hypothetical protein
MYVQDNPTTTLMNLWKTVKVDRKASHLFRHQRHIDKVFNFLY